MALNTRLQRQIDYYKQQFQADGNAHYLFACHAAFPVVFSVDMLHQLWTNFNIISDVNIPKVVISDFLLSNLCQEVGLGLYEFRDKAIRTALLHDLEQQFDKQHRNRLAAFLYQYARKHYNTPEYENLKDTHQWTALATLNPQEAIQKIGDAISKSVVENDTAEKMRIHSLLEEIVEVQPVLGELFKLSEIITEKSVNNSFIPSLSENSTNEVILKIQLPKFLHDKIQERKRSEKLTEQLRQVIEGKSKTIRLNHLGFNKIPSEIFQLENIEHLELFGNKITQIPSEIIRFKKLKNLYLSSNPISEIPDYVFNLESLEKLRISNAKITTIPISITKAKKLKGLHLSENYIKQIPLEITALKSLEYLSLSHNEIRYLPFEIIYELPDIKYLEVHKNSFANVPKELVNNADFLGAFKRYLSKFIDISSERLQTITIPLIQEIIINKIVEDAQTNSILNIDLSYLGLIKIPEKILKLKYIESLNLKGNSISDIPTKFKEIETIKRLNISNNPINIFSNNLLEVFSIEELNLSNSRILNIPNNINALGQLKILNLKNNYIKEIPYNITKLNHLINVDLRGNPINIVENKTYKEIINKLQIDKGYILIDINDSLDISNRDYLHNISIEMQPKLYGHILSRGCSQDIANDIIQDVFITFYQHFSENNNNTVKNHKAYLLVITLLKYLNYRRREQRNK